MIVVKYGGVSCFTHWQVSVNGNSSQHTKLAWWLMGLIIVLVWLFYGHGSKAAAVQSFTENMEVFALLPSMQKVASIPQNKVQSLCLRLKDVTTVCSVALLLSTNQDLPPVTLVTNKMEEKIVWALSH